MTSMKSISDIWPNVIFVAGSGIPTSLRKRFVKA